MKQIKMWILMVVFSLYAVGSLSAIPSQQIQDALEASKECVIERAVSHKAFKTISEADIYEGSLGYQIPGSYGNISMTSYFIVDGEQLFSFDSLPELFTSSHFLATISDDFHLQSIDDGLLFQQFLYEIDENYFNEGFFIDNKNWYFVRDDFFGDLEAWIVRTDENGKILSIEFTYDGAFTMKEERYHDVSSEFRYETDDLKSIPNHLKEKIASMMEEDFNSEISVDQIEDISLQSISNAHFFNCEISIISTYEDMVSTSYYDVLAFENGNEILFYEDNNDLVTSPIFIESIKDEMVLTNDEKARTFETALDFLIDFDRNAKNRFERNGQWIFIRDEFFDEGRGFIVDTDGSGHITHIEYSWEIPLEGVEVPIEVPFDESTVEWTFNLIDPCTSSITMTSNEVLPVEIEFNDWASNQIGAWIGTFQDGYLVGIYAGNTISSPFTDAIPGEYLNQGDNLISYRLLYPGDDYENPIEKVDLHILIE